MFVELALSATRPEGRTSQFVPENFYNGANAAAIRAQIFENTTLERLLCFENRREIWFKDVDSRAKFALFVVRNQGKTEQFPAVFGITTNEALAAVEDNLLGIPVAVVREFSPDAVAVMEFSNQFEIDIARKMYTRFPKFGERIAGIPYREYQTEVHMGNDRGLFDEDPSGLPVYEGRMVAAFDYRAKATSVAVAARPTGSSSRSVIPRSRSSRNGTCPLQNSQRNWEIVLSPIVLPSAT